MAISGRQFPISSGELAATVTEVGATLRGFTAGGVDITVPYSEDVLTPHSSGTVLVPWPNRLRGGQYWFEGEQQQLALTEPELRNAIHGLARWSRWTAVLHEPSRVTLEFDVPPQKGYPFEVRIEVTYALDADNGLSLTMSATNHGTRRAPFGAGWHPYLSTRGATLDETTVRLPAAQRLLLDDVAVPVGSESVTDTPYDLRVAKRLDDLRMDDAFTALSVDDGRSHAEVRGQTAGARVWWDETFRFLQVYTSPDVIDGRPGVAVEPMTCAPDAFNSCAGLLVLEADGGSWTGSCGITPL